MELIFMLLGICILQTISCSKAQELGNQNFGDFELTLSKHHQDIHNIQVDMTSNLVQLRKVQGFLTAIGIGRSSGNESPCVGWTQFTPFRCIKIVQKVETYDNALKTCFDEFEPGRDINHPQLLQIADMDENNKIVKILENFTSVSGIWVRNELTNYTNFETSHYTSFDCVELRDRGQWSYVDCESKNSIICEKSVTQSYSLMVKIQIELVSEFTKFQTEVGDNIKEVYKNQESFNKTIGNMQAGFKIEINSTEIKFQNMERKFEILQKQYAQMLVLTNTSRTSSNPHATRDLERYPELVAKIATSLPHSLWYTSSVYDGKDGIYILGGLNFLSPMSTIYRFNISSNTIIEVGSFPTDLYGGVVTRVANGIFYFGGFNGSSQLDSVFEFAPRANTTKEVEQTGAYLFLGDVLQTKENPVVVFIIDGQTRDKRMEQKYVHTFDINTRKSLKRNPLKSKIGRSSGFVVNETAILFTMGSSSIEILNLTSFSSELLETNLPTFTSRPAVVSDGTFGYIIGSYENSSTYPSNALIRFDPITLQHEFILVENFPGLTSINFEETSAVYVKRLNRIYLTGGFSYMPWVGSAPIIQDKIWYIELDKITKQV